LKFWKWKNSFESLTNRLDQVEERISGLEDKKDELQHSDKNKEKIRNYKRNILGHH
jgi:hypothetical protein